MNVESRKAAVIDEIFRQYGMLYLFPLHRENPGILGGAEAGGELFAKSSEALNGVNAMRYDTLTVLGFIPPEEFSDFSEALGGLTIADTYFEEGYRNTLAEQAKSYGADRVADCIVAFEMDGDLYLLCSEVLEYGGRWYIHRMGGSLAAFLYLPSELKGLMPLTAMGAEESIDVDAVRKLFGVQ
jgi:hypothetical protein